jgi:hypothetical protein
MARQILAPEKELRFTRAGQAGPFWILAAIGLAATAMLGSLSWYRHLYPNLLHPVWALLPLALSALSLRLAWHLTRHAYLILSPIGVEIFPFFRPAKGMRLIYWQEIHSADVNADFTEITFHFNPEHSSGVKISLQPIAPNRRSLLAKALHGRLSPAAAGTEHAAAPAPHDPHAPALPPNPQC